MPLLVVGVSVLVLLLLMTRLRLNGFAALLLVAVGVALVQGIPVATIPDVLSEGIGGQIGDTMLTIGLGAMVGRVMGDSGAAQRIAGKLLDAFGPRWVQVAMVVTAMLIGVTMFYEVAFIIIVPIAFTLVRVTGAPLLWVGLPMSITLSTMHSFLPPHPGPTAVAATFDASVGLTLLYGLFIAVPAGAFIALLWPRLPFIKAMTPSIPQGLVTEREFTDEEMPGLGWSLFVALFPVALIVAAAVTDMATSGENGLLHFVAFIGSAPIALLLTLCLAVWAFGPRIGRSLEEVGASCSSAAKAMAMILLVIGAGGAFKNVLVEGGISDYIKDATDGWSISPIILAWLVAVILRIALGSATVAVVTASGVVLPLLAGSGVHPEVMVLAVACGSIAFSHVNDPGFWLFKEYFNLSVIEAIKVRTSYTTVLAILGLGGVLIAEQILDALSL
ncbi:MULTISPECIES: gluconate:H+ symporter [Streptomyces]|uniref:Gluconate:H+ symporter n=1 Tax=Streptomyces caniscabiei TaxID=2746961 RepID=A0ABU4MMW6_9ACTN|nr:MULTISPECIES: gluconate:H+ symporter [Streptomyces]MBE4738505.1 gluconate permease [Streptomyces caniscabiei]MBE4756698.1 gluconate permease [Streptomyces caniscabiei]MBE4768797.1 gluconate permease [Streptomyces caniscabiei]MBE4792373.1 gluconate permease [Streptomyces caniscabiei]MDX2946031.1 gluconate:H+ symporter [Streptomyces caniscabiei]